MESDKNICCADTPKNSGASPWSGVLYGLLPHSVCIAFALFSVMGAVTATAFLKKFMLMPNLFSLLVIVSLLLATISVVIYLKKTGCLCVPGIKKRWHYIFITYCATIVVNLLMFFVVIPLLTNASFAQTSEQQATAVTRDSEAKISLAELSLAVQIPCTGHAPLILDEIRKNYPVDSMRFESPNIFKIKYDPRKVSAEKILSLEIFKTYRATID